MRVAIIPARGGSQRIPRKNIRLFHGKPIIAYSIETARASGLFDAIYVSTEDPKVADIALDCCAIVIHRPAALAEINAPDCGTQEVTRHALMALNITDGEACCIYATAPLMHPVDLYRGYRALMSDPRSTFSFAVALDPLRDAGQWYWGRVPAFLSREPLDMNGVSVWKNAIPDDRVCDINTPEDWQLAEEMYAALHGEIAHG